LVTFVSGPKIYLLLETGLGEGVGDHTTLMIHKYAEHAELMSRMPVIDVDYYVAKSAFGYGLKSLKVYKKGDVAGNSFIIISIIIYYLVHFLFCFWLLLFADCLNIFS